MDCRPPRSRHNLATPAASAPTRFSKRTLVVALAATSVHAAACSEHDAVTPTAFEEDARVAQALHHRASWVVAGDHLIDFVYSYDEMFAFDSDTYLAARAPHLRPHAETISHFAGRSSISPRFLIALIEHESQAISRADVWLDRPFGTLSDATGFIAQTKAVTERLAEGLYAREGGTRVGSAQRAVRSLFSADDLEIIGDTYLRLFPDSRSNKFVSQRGHRGALVDIGLQFPWPIGESWKFGGAHTTQGSGDFPLSSLDLFDRGNWGDDLTDVNVVAAGGGTVKVHSSCSIEIVHDEQFSTSYYHMDNLAPASGSTIDINTKIGNYASDKAQALCNGGASSGPHVHFTLKKDGMQEHLLDYELSYYLVHPGQTSYDSDCSRFWLEKDGVKVCSWTPTLKRGSRRRR